MVVISEANIELRRPLEKRTLANSPSRRLSDLVQKEPSLLNHEVGSLCVKTPINYLGALIAEQGQAEIRLLIRGTRFSDLYSQIPPLMLIENQVVNISEEKIVVPLVLVKQGCGRHSGLILTGDFAGLILKAYPVEQVQQEGMITNRVWNDELLSQRVWDSPEILSSYQSYIMISRDRTKRELEASIELTQYFITRYEELKQNYQYTFKAFFALCEQLLPREVVARMNYSKFAISREYKFTEI